MRESTPDASQSHDITFSLVQGDPPYHIQQKLGLIPSRGLGVPRRVLFFILLTWAPMMVWALVSRRLFPGLVTEPLLEHFGVHVRCLVAIPLLIAAEAVAEITTTLDDLNRRLEVYSAQLFRQARWEAERFTSELLSDLAADQAVPLAERAAQSAGRAVGTVERLAPPIERAAGVAQEAPKIVAVERKAAFKALHGELARTIQFVHDERHAAMDDLTKELSAALQELHDTIATERQALTSDVEQLSLKVVDHAMGQLARLLGAAMAAAVMTACLGLFLVRRLFFRRPLDIRRE